MSNDFEPGDLKDDWHFSPFFLWLENLYWENPPQLFDAFCRHSGYREKTLVSFSNKLERWQKIANIKGSPKKNAARISVFFVNAY